MIRYHIEKDHVYTIKLKGENQTCFLFSFQPLSNAVQGQGPNELKGRNLPQTPTLYQMSPILDQYTWNQTRWCSEHSNPLSMSLILCQYMFKEKAYNNLPMGLASRAQEHTHLLRTQVAQFYTNGQQSETLHRNKQSESHFSMAMSLRPNTANHPSCHRHCHPRPSKVSIPRLFQKSCESFTQSACPTMVFPNLARRHICPLQRSQKGICQYQPEGYIIR